MESGDFLDDELYKRARDFEQKLDSGQGFYCDTDELEEIIEFYFEHEQYNKAWNAISFGLTLFPYENYYQVKKAEVLLNKKEIQKAIMILEDAKVKEPNNPEIAKLLADCFSQTMQYKRAEELYRYALKMGFETDVVIVSLVRMQFLIGRPEKAVSYLSYFPDEFYYLDTIIPEMVKIFIDNDYTRFIIPFLKRIINVQPYSWTTWYYLAFCYQKMEEYEKAMDAFEYCIAIDEFNSMGHLGKGNCLMELGKHEEAISYFNDAIDHDITDAEVYCNIAECYEHLKNLNSAKYYYLKAIKVDKHLSDAYYGLGMIYKEQQRLREAEKNLLRALDLDPFEALFHIEAAELFLLMDKKEQCFHHYEKAREIDPKTEEIALDFAHAMFHFQEIEHAVAMMIDEVENAGSDHRFLYRIAAYLFHLGEYESGYNYLHKALKEKPEDFILLYEFAPFAENNETVTNIIDLYLLK